MAAGHHINVRSARGFRESRKDSTLAAAGGFSSLLGGGPSGHRL